MEEKGVVEAFYQRVDEEERLADRQGYVEYMTTMSYIHQYLEPHMRIAEIGAGTGRYSLALAREGYHVEAVELVERNIQVFRSKLREEDDIRVIQGNALDLSPLAEDFTWTANENDAFSLVRPADIRELTKDFPVERLHLAATDGATRYLGDMVERMEERLYRKYLEYHFSICEREDLIGASNHVLDVLRKDKRNIQRE